MSNVKYIHTTEIHNTDAARLILPYLLNLISPTSVIDVGCGTGTWLKVCLDLGITDIFGVDGDYVDKKLLVIPDANFLPYDLQVFLKPERKFDLVISLEVAEHLEPEAAETFVDTLTAHGDVVLFSAAIKRQGGQRHLNEQDPSYWEDLFRKRGYLYYDVIRPVFWNNKQVDWWYRQNIFLVSKVPIHHDASQLIQNSNLYVHPDLYYIKVNEVDQFRERYENIMKGKGSFKSYLKLLIKSIFQNG